MPEITKDQIIHDGAIDYLLRGCERVFESEVIERDVLPSPHHIFYRSDTHLHDLARFANEVAEKVTGVNRDKLVAGFSVGVFIVSKSDIPIRDFRIKTESITTPDIDLESRLTAFEQLAFYDSIHELHGAYFELANPRLRGKNYDLGVRAMLAAGYFVLTDTVEAMNAEDAKRWFRDTHKLFREKKTNISSEDLIDIS
jgi:hypothetical protein